MVAQPSFAALLRWCLPPDGRWRFPLAVCWFAVLGIASAQPFSIGVSVAPITRDRPIVAAAATSDLVSFASVRLRGRADVALTGGVTFGGAVLVAARQEGVDLYAGGGVGFGAVATDDSSDPFLAPYWLMGLRVPLIAGVGLVLEARGTPRWRAATFAFGLDLGFGP